MATTEKKTKEKRPQGKQTWRKVTKKIKKPVKKPVRKAKRQRGRSATKNAKPSNGNPDTMRGASPTLITQDEYSQVQSMKDKNPNDSHITTFFGTCQEGLSLTRCTERSTKKSFLCVTTLNKLGDDCTIHYVRPRGTRGDTTTSKYYSIEVDEAPGERGLLVEDINVPLLVDELPANTSLIDLHDLDKVTFTGKAIPVGTTTLRLVNVNLKGYPSRSFANITLPLSLRRINLMRNKMTTFAPSDWNESAVESLNVANNLLTTLGPVVFPSKVTSLNFRSNDFTDSSFAGTVFPQSLTSLRLGKNKLHRIDSVPVANLPQLDLLELSENKDIKTLDAAAAKALPPSLVQLDLFDCSVTTITSDFSLPPSLQVLVLSRNNITTFPSALVLSPKLTHLHLSENPLMDFKVNQDGFKRLQALAHFSADTQNMECDPGTEKKLVANTSYVCVVGNPSTSVLENTSSGDSSLSPNFGAVQLVLVVAGAIVGVLGVVMAVCLLRRRRLLPPSFHDPDDKSTPSSSQPYHVRRLGPQEQHPTESSHQLVSTFAGYSTEVATTNKSFAGYTTVVASTNPSFGGYTVDDAHATNKSFGVYTTDVTPTIVSFPGDTAILASRRSDASAKSSVSSSASCSSIDSHLVHTPTWLAGMSTLTKLVIPGKSLTGVHPFLTMYAGMWSDRPVVLQPLQASNPPATLQILASLSHPNIVSLYGITWSNDMVVSCVVERCPRNLQTFLSSDERIPLATKLAIAADVATALLFLHSMHVVHDRLSDTQVFIMDNGTAKVNFPRVTAPSRWSTASDTEEGGETKDYDVWAVEAAHRLVWTSPERLSNDEDLAGDNESRCKADVYALGILISTLERQSLPGNEQQRSEHAVGVVAEALRGDTSRRRRMSVVEHCPDVEWFTPQCPAPLRALITKCLHVFPPDRPTSMDVACQLREMARQAAATK
ncbi:TKL/RAF protein kinase [Aphanomyces invadans]|uniref:TKL/RAF protein kinase n=1 Tax=Aphanomyces invadans TaxID=157072 RepID=A0A024U7Z2_9STRA|nr:TKL/RAF protein kinase [Aphanomyces invadans]ETW02551.1 TKL/RAF protein kinase [Aphanomyces invadans]|eukprot:XP_008869156.1 TKL/RAF protein kinase [Aphanomyces invadans]